MSCSFRDIWLIVNSISLDPSRFEFFFRFLIYIGTFLKILAHFSLHALLDFELV
uniref:Uncharacterized protein n=1 Tax=Manihot esculenta TaxID=3983 RepID=A0A2C9UFK9_MANES